ncbi:MAG TPA: potassium/proton antiporter [Longimicrobiales bacterium]|nr:potassium/proton antiporter [Longimicrobiales bacterium]
MFTVDRLVLVAALLAIVGIASSKLSSRIGLPGLVVFVAIGMLAGSEGLGGIAFEDYGLAHAVGTVALAVIIFDGGLRTSFARIRPVLAPAAFLATVGVLVTAALTGVAAYVVLGLPVLESLLLGSIVGSTDAAAVFTVLRSSSMNLPPRLASTLEVESGSNDPMAVFLTIGLLEVLLAQAPLGSAMALLFVQQMTIGALVGLAIGRLAVWMTNRIALQAAGLYAVLAGSLGLFTYGLAASLGGSGFLAVYLAGVVMGSHRLVFQRGILLALDGAAWLAQIAMFVLLGLLSFPSRLLEAAGAGLIVAGASILIARPAAVIVSLLPFRYTPREMAFMSLGGLKGAVPIVLGTYPLLLGLPDAEGLFDVVFFIVLASALVQGWSMPPFARLLGLHEPELPKAAVSLEITSLGEVDADIVEYTIRTESPVVGRAIRELALPDEAVIAMIVREERMIPPRGSTRIRAQDHVFIVINRGVRQLVEALFLHGHTVARSLSDGIEFPLRASTTLADLREIYGLSIEGEDPDRTLDEILRTRLGDRLAVGRGIELGPFKVRVREVSDGVVESAGLLVRPIPETGPPRPDSGESG